MNKQIYQKASYSLYLAFSSIFLMIAILFLQIKWMMVGGLFISFILAVASVIFGIISLRFIGKNEDKFRGESMSWISICLGVLALMGSLPFVLAFLFAV